MTISITTQKLAEITDEGLFESLATAILRESEPCCMSLVHTGINSDGKTVKSPVDGITFVSGAHPPLMVIVHHTIAKANNLEKKWLHKPALVKLKGKSKIATAPEGDVIKTIKIVQEEKLRTPNLKSLLILTTNQEPNQKLVRDVQTTAIASNIEIKIWSRSQFAHFLDNDAKGQWLRREYLGIEQELLSEKLLMELCRKNLEIYAPQNNLESCVERNLDKQIEDAKNEDIVFLVGESGCGKSIACYKRLLANINYGNYSLVLSDSIIESSFSVEQAVEKALLQLHPALSHGSGASVLQFARSKHCLMLTVEDISRSGRASVLIERISKWNQSASTTSQGFWQILCPMWPQILSSLSEDTRKAFKTNVIEVNRFSPKEGTRAVEKRWSNSGHEVTEYVAASISTALGNDPLLIALHNPELSPDANTTIKQFIEKNIQILASSTRDFFSSEFHNALRNLAKTMLMSREMEPRWSEISSNANLKNDIPPLRQLLHNANIIRLTPQYSDQKIAFRHDRVRAWLLADAAAQMLREGVLNDEILAEPYYAEIFGQMIARFDVPRGSVAVLANRNVLALFNAVKFFSEPPKELDVEITTMLEIWLADKLPVETKSSILYWDAIKILSEIDNPIVLKLASKFDDKSWNCLRARYRNGDVSAGIKLCLSIEPGVTVAGHESFLEHVKSRFGDHTRDVLNKVLVTADIKENLRIGALRLAGHLADANLADAIRVCWSNHTERLGHLDEYLWAACECADSNAETLLEPIFDAWASLPNDSEEKGLSSPRDELAAHNVRWAFQKRPPTNALNYIIMRASDDELKWQITYLLHGIDHPEAVNFVVREMAKMEERLEDTGSFSPFVMLARNDWERRQDETGNGMSEASRTLLLNIWADKDGDKHLRKQAFRLWSSTFSKSDISILQSVGEDDELYESAIWQRLLRNDKDAISVMIAKIAIEKKINWWQLGRNIWTDELTNLIDIALVERRAKEKDEGDNADWIISELVMRMPPSMGERMLIKNWDNLCNCSYYVLTALYLATPKLNAMVEDVVKVSSNPKELFKYIIMRFGYRVKNRPGINRPEQIKSLIPYLNFLSDHEISDLWEVCNKMGWYQLRRDYLDSRLNSNNFGWQFLSEDRIEMCLNEFLKEGHHWVDKWLDDFIETGVTTDYVFEVIGRWFEKNKTLAALQIVRQALLHIGNRRHLEIIKNIDIEPKSSTQSIILDTEFGLKRRTLQ